MNRIVSKQQFSENVFKFEVEAPLIAKSRRAGHFVIIRIGEKGERIPLTICDDDKENGTITIVFQTVGAETYRMPPRRCMFQRYAPGSDAQAKKSASPSPRFSANLLKSAGLDPI